MGHVAGWEWTDWPDDGRNWVQVGRRPLVAGVGISSGQLEKWEQQSIVT
jgi:hypothetical protein